MAAINPDVTILHAQQADEQGSVLIRGITGAAREAALAARCLLVTVEARVERLDAPLNAIVLPQWLISAVSIVPGGAHPSYAAGCYPRDNRFYGEWDAIARERGRFQQSAHSSRQIGRTKMRPRPPCEPCCGKPDISSIHTPRSQSR